MGPSPLQLAAVLVCLLSWFTRTSASSCVGPPSGSGFACSTAPQVVLRPNGSADDQEGRHLWLDADNETLCACALTPIAKCCPPGSAIEADRCANASVEFRPVINGPDGNLSLALYRKVEMQCGDSERVVLSSWDYVGVTAAGQLQTTVAEVPLVEPGRFCLETGPDGGHQVVLVCVDSSGPHPQYVAFAAVLLASALFMLATVAAHLALPKLRTLHGGLVCCYSLSRVLCHLAFASMQLASHSFSNAMCEAHAFIAYFSYLSSFFWLNVMAFDIFWTFSGFRSLSQRGRGRNQKKFIVYSVYSWGCPLIFLSVALVMQYSNNIPDGLLRPQFGVQKCWFPDDKFTSVAYFRGPVVVLVVCNMILFTLTAIRTRQFKKEVALLSSSDSGRHFHDSTKRFIIYLILFVFMSVSCLVDIVTWNVDTSDYLRYAINTCTTLEGVFIFVIYIWKVRIRRMIMEKLCRKKASGELDKSTVESYSSGVQTVFVSSSATATMDMRKTQLLYILENKT